MELLAIEKELAGPDGQSALKRYDEVLVNLGARIRAAMDRGLEPAAFAKCSALAEAVPLARKLLRLQLQSASLSPSSTST